MIPLLRDDPALYADWVAEGRDILLIEEGAQWLCGDHILRGRFLFPERTMHDFADDLKIAAATAYERGYMAAFYDASARAEFAALDLSYSHLREARRLGTLDAARDFLMECAAKQYSVSSAAVEVRKRLGQRLPPEIAYRGPCTLVKEGGRVYLSGIDTGRMSAGKEYDITIRERPS